MGRDTKIGHFSFYLIWFLSSSVSKLFYSTCTDFQCEEFQTCTGSREVTVGMWLSGRAFALHVKGPGFDPRHLQRFFFLYSIIRREFIGSKNGYFNTVSMV